MTRLAAVLRRIADRIDPTPARVVVRTEVYYTPESVREAGRKWILEQQGRGRLGERW